MTARSTGKHAILERDATMSLASTIARNAGVQAAADLLGKVASLAFYVVMARELGQHGFGDFTFALSLALMLTVFADFGTDETTTRMVAVDRGRARQLLTDALAVKAVLGLAGVAAAVVVAFVGGYTADVRAAVAILAVAAVVELLAKSFYAIFQAFDDMRPIAASLVIQRYVTAIAGIAAMLAGAGVVGVAAIYLGGALLALAYAATRLARLVRPSTHISSERARALARASAAIGVGLLLGTALFRIDAVMLSQLKGNAAVGLYGVAYRLLESTLFISFTFVAALLPTLSRLTRATTPGLGEVFELGLKLIASALLAIGTGFVLFAEPVVRILYTSEYDAAIPAVRLLGVAAAFYGVSYLAAHVLIAQRRQRVLPWITLAVLILNVGLNLLVIPTYSFKGAAAVTSVSEVAVAVGTMWFALRVTGPVSLRRIATGPLAGCAAIGVVALVAGTGLLGLVVAALVYPPVLFVVERRLFPSDVRLLLGVLRRRSPVADVTS
jgi:O-antigen/teichoic acid export membrane protein